MVRRWHTWCNTWLDVELVAFQGIFRGNFSTVRSNSNFRGEMTDLMAFYRHYGWFLCRWGDEVIWWAFWRQKWWLDSVPPAFSGIWGRFLCSKWSDSVFWGRMGDLKWFKMCGRKYFPAQLLNHFKSGKMGDLTAFQRHLGAFFAVLQDAGSDLMAFYG